jgi:Serine dehydrogenase proteinase
VPSWNELLDEFEGVGDDTQRAAWLSRRLPAALRTVRERRGGRNVLFYASAFLQKPATPAPSLQITHEDLNGFMSVIHEMDWSRGLTLLMHTPGGVTNAAETIVSYLGSKFNKGGRPDFEVIVPAYAMSAGTMISLASTRIVMGRQSQLGPIDPQMPLGGRFVSARAIVDQFERAKGEIMSDTKTAHVWAPVLQSLGPALLQEAQNALDYGEQMVARWLEHGMFRGHPHAHAMAKAAAHHFNDAFNHKSHGRRIDRDEARAQRIEVEDLETDQVLQDAALTAYHMATIIFEKGPGAKVLVSDSGRTWMKNTPGPRSL